MKNAKTILTISILLIIISFFAGYFWTKFFPELPSNKTINTKKSIDSVLKNNSQKDVIEPNNSLEITKSFSKKLKGKYVLEGADYAGFDFVDDNTLTWTNEMFPMDPDTMKLKWVAEDVFVGIFIQQNKDCSPNIWVNKVVSYDDNKLVLKDIWTGWGDSKDKLKAFHLEVE